MYSLKRKAVILLGLLGLLFGCYRPGMDEYWKDGRYALLAIDVKSEMSLAWIASDGSYITVVDSTVFAVGSNANYIIVKRHPKLAASATKYDRSITECFVVKRVTTATDSASNVQGPLTEEQLGLINRVNLPSISKVFDDLK